MFCYNDRNDDDGDEEQNKRDKEWEEKESFPETLGH